MKWTIIRIFETTNQSCWRTPSEIEIRSASWYSYPSEKSWSEWVRQLGWWNSQYIPNIFPIYGYIYIYLYMDYSYGFSMVFLWKVIIHSCSKAPTKDDWISISAFQNIARFKDSTGESAVLSSDRESIQIDIVCIYRLILSCMLHNIIVIYI